MHPKRFDHDGQQLTRSILKKGSGDRTQIEKSEETSSYSLAVLRRWRGARHFCSKIPQEHGEFRFDLMASQLIVGIDRAQDLERVRREPPRVGRAPERSQAEYRDRDASELVSQQILQRGAAEHMTFISKPQARLGKRLRELRFVVVRLLSNK